MDVSSFYPSECSVERLTGIHMSPEDFSNNFDKTKKPVILSNMQSNWSGKEVVVGWIRLVFLQILGTFPGSMVKKCVAYKQSSS